MAIVVDRKRNEFVLENRFLRRRLVAGREGFCTVSLVNLGTGTEYCRHRVPEFSFTAGGAAVRSFSEEGIREVDGNPEERQDVPELLDAEVVARGPGDQELRLTFRIPCADLRVLVSYRLDERLPGTVKRLGFQAGRDPVTLTDLALDSFDFYPGSYRDCHHYLDDSREELPLNFGAEGTADAVCCFNRRLQEGYWAATSAPGPLRRILGYVHWSRREITYSMGSAPFAKSLAPGEEFLADETMLLLCQGDRFQAKAGLRELARKILPPSPPSGVMYCTWLPFLKRIEEGMLLDLAGQAAALGCGWFVLDDGWFTQDHRQVDRRKLPSGLPELSRRIRALGMRFGLWYNIGTSYGDPDTPDAAACRLADQSVKTAGKHRTLCWAEESHRRKVLQELSGLAETCQVSYFKLDFSSICSPYLMLPWGCHSREHSHHRGFDDSFIEMYRGLEWLRRELRNRFPELLVDFSFESFGTDRPTLGALKCSDLNHVSNLSGLDPEYQDISRIRRTFYRWFELLPSERILGGLLVLMDDRALECLLTSFAGVPLVSGDLRRLPEDVRRNLRKAIQAYRELAAAEPLTELETFVDDQGRQDGFLRKGPSGHGFLCLFNHADQTMRPDLDLPFPCRDVLTGGAGPKADPHSCTMLRF